LDTIHATKVYCGLHYKVKYKQESCAIAKMTVRCTLYKCIGSPVTQIRPFEIIQDGSRPPTLIWCNQK